MKEIKTIQLFVFTMLILTTYSVSAQNIIKPTKGYSPQIGVIVSMMEDLKGRITYSVANLDMEKTDFLLDQDANRIGALIFHLAATEKYYQVYTFENRGFNEEERAVWEMALNLGDDARDKLIDKPIDYYLKSGVKCEKNLCNYLNER